MRVPGEERLCIIGPSYLQGLGTYAPERRASYWRTTDCCPPSGPLMFYWRLISRAVCRASRLTWRASRRSSRLSWRPARRSWRRSIPTVCALATDAVTKLDPAKPNIPPSPRSARVFRREIVSDMIHPWSIFVGGQCSSMTRSLGID